MRLRLGLSLPEKGGRPAIIGAEVFEDQQADKTRRWHYVVGFAERVRAHTIEGAVARMAELTDQWLDLQPCAFVDVGTPQGLAARRSMKKTWPEALHRPHAYERTKFDTSTFATFLEAYADGRVLFRPGLAHKAEMDRALVLFRGGDEKKSGDELASEDEALVNALCLALSFPTHGHEPRPLTPATIAPPNETSVIMGTLTV